jgi:hypothetical protein
MIPRFTVSALEAQKFSQVWTQRGLAVPLAPEHLQFATDFANVVLNNFITSCMHESAVRKQVQTQEDSTVLVIQGN